MHKKILISVVNSRDIWVWHYDKKGIYNVKSGYKLYMNLKINSSASNSTGGQKIWKQMWKLNIPKKIKHFIWRAIHNILPTESI